MKQRIGAHGLRPFLLLCALSSVHAAPLPGLSATALGAHSVRLAWPLVAGATGYRVTRNGAVAASLPADATGWVDAGVPARTRLRYDVEAQGVGPLAPATVVTGPETEQRALRPAHYDVLVYAANPGGIAAAVALGRRGRRVLLVEPGEALGGMITGGLGRTDFGSIDALGGPFQRLMRDVSAWYSDHYPADHPNQTAKRDGLYFEPSVARAVFERWLAEVPSVTVVRGCHLLEALRDGRRVSAVSLLDQRRGVAVNVSADAWIDASYEGDLAAMAGAPYRIGRESGAEFGEKYAGRLWWDVWQRKVVQVDGVGDRRVQAYNYRLCLTRDPANRAEPQPPASYDRERYLGLLPDIAAGRLKALTDILSILPLPNGKFDANNHPQGNPSSDLVGGADRWPEADWDTRAALAEAHREHVLGLLWFLRTDLAVPAPLREDAASWGLAADEFPEQASWPSSLYVREGRRIVGETTFTEHDAMAVAGGERPSAKRDSVAVGAYPIDSHATGGRHPDHPDWLEGFFYLARGETQPYGIPYGVMLPQRLDNVIVCGAVSSTHVGYGSLRMEPVFMSLGLAAGVAADHALREQRPFATLSRPRLQLDLLAQQQILTVFRSLPATTPGWAGFQLWGAYGAFPSYEANAAGPMDDAAWQTWLAHGPLPPAPGGAALARLPWLAGLAELARHLRQTAPTVAGERRCDAMAALWTVYAGWVAAGAPSPRQ